MGRVSIKEHSFSFIGSQHHQCCIEVFLEDYSGIINLPVFPPVDYCPNDHVLANQPCPSTSFDRAQSLSGIDNRHDLLLCWLSPMAIRVAVPRPAVRPGEN